MMHDACGQGYVREAPLDDDNDAPPVFITPERANADYVPSPAFKLPFSFLRVAQQRRKVGDSVRQSKIVCCARRPPVRARFVFGTASFLLLGGELGKVGANAIRTDKTTAANVTRFPQNDGPDFPG